MPTLAKPCVVTGSCPGDLGDTEVLWKGRQMCVSKASGIIKVFGALEAALGHINQAVVTCEKQAKCLKRAYWALFNLGLYHSTGEDYYYGQSIYILKKALKCTLPMLPDSPLGWLYCADLCCATIKTARVWVRWVERRVAALEEGKEAILILNHLGNILFELMRTTHHSVKTRRGLVTVKPREEETAPAWL
ncbi:MAG: ATP:cob(I)alamin adenosyltransferase [Pyrobaculum sp.]|uniref:ATP:cob(I)alamin adenosyltransferase n=1 Tax=Pyrobaculum sp. TaxID=2004705 RepID=UPI003EEDF8B8